MRKLATFIPYQGRRPGASTEGRPEPGAGDPEFQRLVADIRAGWRAETNPPQDQAPHITLGEYRAMFRPEQLPAPGQMADFLDFMTCAHSWYKHLPRYLPGETFTFYLDPGAGWNCVQHASGRIEYHPMPEREHYNHRCTTEEWHRRFGAQTWARNALEGPLLHPPAGRCRLPQEVLSVARVQVTALFNDQLHMLPLLLTREPRQGRWLWEGRPGAHAEALDVCGRILDLRHSNDEDGPTRRRRQVEAEARLEELVAPERERQRAAMRRAMEQVVSLVRAGRIDGRP